MKKGIILTLLLCSLFSFIGCSNIQDKYNSSDEIIQSDEYPSDLHISPVNYTFESVIESSTDIFIGELIGVRMGSNLSGNVLGEDPLKTTDYVEYEFEIKDVIFSEYDRSPESIKVYFHDYSLIEEDLGYNPKFDCTFYEGVEYLLPVQINDKPYYISDVYHIPGDMVLSLEQEVSRYSSLMGEKSIITNEGIDLAKNVDKDQLLVYINSLLVDKAKSNSYSREKNIMKVADFSDNIFKVQVKELVQTRKSDVIFCETFTIEIMEVIKGKNISESEIILIDFVGGSVKSGDILFVGLDNGSYRYNQTGYFYNLTSSLFFSQEDITLIQQNKTDN